MTTGEPIETVERYPDGKIPASRRYIDYDGQVVIRTRYATIQRWTKPGWDVRRRRAPAYILTSEYCTGENTDSEPMNDHLDTDEVEVYYVADGETVRFNVTNNNA